MPETTGFRRLLLASSFVILLLGYGFAPAQVRPGRVRPLVTEEGQQVVFDKITWQLRELTKRLPPDQPWPAGAELQASLVKYGLKDTPVEQAIPVPAEIERDVYLVGQDQVSNLTYLIDCGPEGVAIIDPTYESQFERTLANVEKCGYSRSQIRWVLNTHCHIDHAMADGKFRDLGAQILVPESDADAVEKGSRITAYYIVSGQTSFPKCKVDRRLSDGEELRLGNKLLHVIHTPGHTPGSASFLLQAGEKNLLFSGDTVLYDNRLGWQGNPYADNQRYLASLKKLATFRLDAPRLQFDLLLPGHGAIAMDKAYMDVQKARDTVEADLAAGRDVEGSPFSTPAYRRLMYKRPAVLASR
jgi:glyoxylase-like metal-dependent hydrolase (beta-lactamase superfamily II)